ncbi:hypothetical protein J6590_070450 [Homalodisca vitripennis]|nr:hypothetical protein J6590_070450 [Homalodisca vitripennis]
MDPSDVTAQDPREQTHYTRTNELHEVQTGKYGETQRLQRPLPLTSRRPARTAMILVLSALAALALGGLALPPQHSSSGGSPSSRSYSSGYTGNTYDTSSNQLSGKTGSSYNSIDGYDRPQVSYDHSWGQDRFHPTTYEEDSHKGEVVLPPLDTDSNPSASQDTVVIASNPLQSSSFPQTSDSFNTPGDPVVSGSAPSHQYEIFPSSPNSYDYRLPPPPSPTPYNYPPPSNFYLPADPSPPPPPPPPPPKQESLMESTFYQIGPKIWFIPLWFSIYFVIYVTALLLKTVIKHKLFIPQTQFQYLTTAPAVRSYQMDELTSRITQGLAEAAVRYLRRRL